MTDATTFETGTPRIGDVAPDRYMLASDSGALCMRNIEAMFAGIGSAQPVVTESAPHTSSVTSGVASFAQIIGR